MATKELQLAQEQCDADPLNVELKELDIGARKRSMFLDEAEYSYFS